MAEWLVEHGIGETRGLLLDGDNILAARIHWPGELQASQIAFAKLASKTSGNRRGTAVLEDGREILVDKLPPQANEGSTIGVQIVRAPVAERGRLKLAQARCFVVGNQLVDPNAKAAIPVSPDAWMERGVVGSFAADAWEDVWTAASEGKLEFRGGELLCSVTPAMSVIDIDGNGSPRELSLAAIPAIARALRWFDVGGNIGIDFPTIESKAERKAVDAALNEALADWPHERTAMNGFGFVQLVTRLEGPSLLHRFATSRTAMCARYALRVAERAEGTGPVLLLRVHPGLQAKLKPEWQTQLSPGISAPTIAEGKVFVADVDAHCVHALNVDTGSVLWSYTTGGRVDVEGGREPIASRRNEFGRFERNVRHGGAVVVGRNLRFRDRFGDSEDGPAAVGVVHQDTVAVGDQ